MTDTAQPEQAITKPAHEEVAMTQPYYLTQQRGRHHIPQQLPTTWPAPQHVPPVQQDPQPWSQPAPRRRTPWWPIVAGGAGGYS